MLQVLPCPQCGKQSLIPNQTSLEATIKCPHCDAILVLGEVFLTQFSSWSVIEDPAEMYDPNPRKLDPGVVIPVPSDDSEIDVLELAADTRPLEPTRAPKNQASGRGIPEFEPRRKRKPKSPVWSILPVILGGFAAFPIALLIIWYVLGKDVGNLGPQIAEYVPWIVPKKFHSSSEPPPGRLPRPRTPQRGDSGFKQFDDVMPQPKVAPELKDLPSDNSEAPMDSNGSDSNDRGADDSKPKSTPIAIDAAPSIDNEVTSEPAEAGPNIFAKIRETQSAVEELAKALSKANPVETKERKTELLFAAYGKLSELEAELQSFDKQTPVWRTINGQMNSLAKQLVQNDKLLGPIGNVTTRAINNQNEKQPIVAAIEIEVTAAEQLTSDWTAFGKHILPADTVIEIPRQVSRQVTAEKKYFALGSFHRSESKESAPVFRVSYLYAL